VTSNLSAETSSVRHRHGMLLTVWLDKSTIHSVKPITAVKQWVAIAAIDVYALLVC